MLMWRCTDCDTINAEADGQCVVCFGPRVGPLQDVSSLRQRITGGTESTELRSRVLGASPVALKAETGPAGSRTESVAATLTSAGFAARPAPRPPTSPAASGGSRTAAAPPATPLPPRASTGIAGRLRGVFGAALACAAAGGLLVLGVALGLALTVYQVPHGKSAAAFLTALAAMWQAAVACVAACAVAALIHDLVGARGGQRWTQLGKVHLRVLVLSAIGSALAVILATKHLQYAPAAVGLWALAGVATAHVAWLLINTIRAVAIGDRRPAWLALVAAIAAGGAGTAVAATGVHRDIQTLGRSFMAQSQRLDAAVPLLDCQPSTGYGSLNDPPAWLRGEVHCQSGTVSVAYLWLEDRHVLGSFFDELSRASGVTFTAGSCLTGPYSGSWNDGSDPAVTPGRLVCFKTGHASYIEWDDYRTDLLMVASTPRSMHDLWHWWSHADGVSRSSLLASSE